jgi:hypothetical protein
MTLSSVFPEEQPTVVFLLERDLVSRMLAMDEHGGHEDLRGLGRWNVTTYVHEGSCCIAQAWACQCVSKSSSPIIRCSLL